jgi:nicotinamide mononucleotide transporter
MTLFGMSLFEIVAVVISFLGIWLTARRHMLCWPVNFLACMLYFKLFRDEKLYADMALQLLFGLSIIYGWFAWRGDRSTDGEVIVRPLSPTEALIGLTAGALGALAIGWFTSHYTDAALPWVDSGLTSFSLVAQLWTARRHKANWLLWIVVDVIYVGMFVFKGLYPTAVLYAAMVGLAVVGYIDWHKAGRRPLTA